VPDLSRSIVATAKAGISQVAVFGSPKGTATGQVVANPNEYGQPQVFLVAEQRPGWLRVALPIRPNNSSGWIKEADVTVSQHQYHIEVSLSGHRFQLFQGSERLLDAPAGIGTTDTPTPGGVYYTWVLIDPTNSGYGAYAYGLSGFSDKLSRFAGADARLGIHGTDDASSIGRDVSRGCIRISDATVTRMVDDLELPLGIPVDISA